MWSLYCTWTLLQIYLHYTPYAAGLKTPKYWFKLLGNMFDSVRVRVCIFARVEGDPTVTMWKIDKIDGRKTGKDHHCAE